MTNNLATGYRLRKRPSLILKQKKYLTSRGKILILQQLSKKSVNRSNNESSTAQCKKKATPLILRSINGYIGSCQEQNRLYDWNFDPLSWKLSVLTCIFIFHVSFLKGNWCRKNGFALKTISLMDDHRESIWLLLKQCRGANRF